MRERVMPDIVQQGCHKERLRAAERDPQQAALCSALQKGAQGAQREIITAQAMFVASMRRPRPDAIDKTQLFDFLQTQKRRGTDQLLFARTQRDQVIQAVAHSTNGLFVW